MSKVPTKPTGLTNNSVSNSININNPWYKTTIQLSVLGVRLKLLVPHDVFSTQRVDEGTALLFEALPAKEPKTVLDVGCGYGALGLTIAARYAGAKVEMIDRDLLAVKWAASNATENQLSNVDIYGSLGFRDLKDQAQTYDWILCNVPARIGKPFVEELICGSISRLSAEGELRIVVINDLAPMIREIKLQKGWPLSEVVKGPRHVVYSVAAKEVIKEVIREVTNQEKNNQEKNNEEKLYLRDIVEIQGISFCRPYDVGGDDPKRISRGLPVLLDALPKKLQNKEAPKILCFRSAYGQVPLICRQRYPEAKVMVIERDLLAAAFTQMNAKKSKLDGDQLEIREGAHFPEGIEPKEKFDLIVGELSASAGEKVAQAEIQAIASALGRGGQAVLVCFEKIEKEWVRPFALRSKVPIYVVISREGHTALRMEL